MSDIILTDKTLISSKDEDEKLKEEKEKSKEENKDENENQNEDENENEDDYENEDEDDYQNKDDETMSQNKKNKIKELNDDLDEIIGKSKSFEDQIESLKKVENLEEYYFINDLGDQELKFKIFKLRLAHLSNEIDEDLFKQIFDHKFETLANKLINTTDKEENQIIVKNIEKNKDKLFEMDEFNDWVIQPQKRSDLKYTIDLILDFNEELN